MRSRECFRNIRGKLQPSLSSPSRPIWELFLPILVSSRACRKLRAETARCYCSSQTTEQTRTLRRDDAAGAAAGLWPSCRAVGGRDSGADQCYRLSLDDFLCAGTGEELRGCQTLRHETVREILPRDAGSWHLPGPITV